MTTAAIRAATATMAGTAVEMVAAETAGVMAVAGISAARGSSSARHHHGSLSKPSPKPFRLIGKPMPSSGVWKMMKVEVWPLRI
jgi:hypothetical protein